MFLRIFVLDNLLILRYNVKYKNNFGLLVGIICP